MRKILSLLLTFLSVGAYAQTITGSLIDEASHPLSFVNVVNVKTQTGTYSDDAGRFTIDVSELKQTDEIVFSHLGYVEIKMSVAQLSAIKDPILMKATDYGLREVVVCAGSAKEFLLDALAHIKDNYPGEFTRNHIKFKNFMKMEGKPSTYESFNFNMYLPSYLAKDSPRIYSENISHDVYTEKQEKLKNYMNPITLLKNMYPEKIFDEKALRENDFAFATSSVVIDSEDYEVINFKHRPQKAEKSIRIEGNAYINKKDKGIRFIDLHAYNLHPDRFMLVAKLDSLNFNLKVAFKKVDGKYVLDYISQSLYGDGRFFGKHILISQNGSAIVLDRLLHLKMNQIVMKTEVDDICTNEKPKDIKDLKGEPDMK